MLRQLLILFKHQKINNDTILINIEMNGINSNPKGYIEEIQKKYEDSDKDIVLDSLAGAIDRLQKAFPGRGHFLMEFIQNADDADSKSMKIEIDKECIKIFNNGDYFDLEDIKSICKVGRSSKTPEHYIGYLGVGFKSVFLISNCPQIYSGSYQFKFDKNRWENPEHTPWQVMPIWIDNNLDVQNESWKTVFIIPKAEEIDEKIMQKLEEEVSPKHLNNRVILFLRNINEFEIHDKIENIKRKIVKSKDISKSNYEICSVDEYKNEELKTKDRWLIFRNSECIVPTEVKEDQATIDWERQNVTKREVLAVFKLDDENNLLEEERGTAHTGVFSFLPLKETESGLRFLIQTDFLTTPGRADIQRESLWNEWLAKEIYTLIEEKCIPEFLNNGKWKFNLTEILYPGSGGHELFDEYIKRPLREYLDNNSILIAEDGSTAKADELISMKPEIRELLTDDDLKMVYPNKKVIHPNCKTELYITGAPPTIKGFIESSEIKGLMDQKAKSGDVEWFKKIYSMFVTTYDHNYFYHKYSKYNAEHDRFWDEMHNFSTHLILTDKNEIAKVTECYTNPKNLNIPTEIRGNFKIVHPTLVEDENFKLFRKKLNKERYYYSPPTEENIKELTETDIENTLKTERALSLTEEEWGNLSDTEKIDKIKSIRASSSDYKVDIEHFGFLTLKTKSGKWLKPDEIMFPKEYNPDHRLETLIEKGFLDFPMEFLSTEFIEKQDNEGIKQWRDFFENLGVDNKIKTEKERNDIVDRIAILTALHFEKKKKNRDAHELTESEQGDPGYDILSKYQDEEETKERYIEVKGSSDTKPEKMLSKKQTKKLMQEEDKYFVYGVVDALNNPTLYVLRGDRILEEEEFRMPIRPAKWEELKEEKYQPLLDS